METSNYTQFSEIFFSCTEKRYVAKETLVPEHVLTHVYEGQMLISEPDGIYTVNPGDTVLLRKNQLGKVTKVPSPGGVCKSISIFFTQSFLQGYYTAHPIPENLPPVPRLHRLEPHPLLESLFNSILPYYDLPRQLPRELIDLKLHEAIAIIRQSDAQAEAILTDFAEPGKIDLAGFMQKNFSFNIPNEKFAYLTGRSLATFKRDFQKVFRMSPQKWLLQKRLEHAHYLITERRIKPSDAYMEAGFENLSHFSRTFKQFFGYNASERFSKAELSLRAK